MTSECENRTSLVWESLLIADIVAWLPRIEGIRAGCLCYLKYLYFSYDIDIAEIVQLAWG